MQATKGQIRDEKIRFILEHSGREAQLLQTIEECAELVQAISKYTRYGKKSLSGLYEELADVLIMQWQCQYMLDYHKITGGIPQKNLDSKKQALEELLLCIQVFSLDITYFRRIWSEEGRKRCIQSFNMVGEILVSVFILFDCVAEVECIVDTKLDRQVERVLTRKGGSGID